MNVVLAGVGGQGTVLASKLIAQAAMSHDLPVREAETIGMAQKGGCVMSHVRIGASPDDEISSPLVPLGHADVILAFEPGEATRVLPYLAKDGVMIVADGAILPVTASLGKSSYVPAEHIAYLENVLGKRVVFVSTEQVTERFGSTRPLNIALLGAACASGALRVDIPEMREAIRLRVKPRFLDMNLAALDLGASAYQTRERYQHAAPQR